MDSYTPVYAVLARRCIKLTQIELKRAAKNGNSGSEGRTHLNDVSTDT